MPGKDELSRTVDFRVTRIPQIRVIPGDFEHCTLQSLGEDVPLQIIGTEHDLLRWALTFGPESIHQLVEVLVERAAGQAMRMSSLDDRIERITRELESTREQLRIERAVREGFERRVASLDGFSRATSKAAEIRLEVAGRDAGQGEEGPRT
jgi:hypothetical protein